MGRFTHLIISASAMLATGLTQAAESPATRLEGLMQQWLAIEQQRETLRLGWQEEQQVLTQRLELLNHEAKSLQKQLQTHSGLKTQAQQQRAALAEQQNALEAKQAQLTQALAHAKQHVSALLARLPEPLQQHWQDNVNKLSRLDNNASKQLDLYLDMYQSFDRFDQRVSVHETLMPLANDGQQEVLVDQLYLGVAKGWYVSRDGQYAGFGEAGPDQWQWHSDNSLSGQIAAIIHATKNPETARILPLSVTLGGHSQ